MISHAWDESFVDLLLALPGDPAWRRSNKPFSIVFWLEKGAYLIPLSKFLAIAERILDASSYETGGNGFEFTKVATPKCTHQSAQTSYSAIWIRESSEWSEAVRDEILHVVFLLLDLKGYKIWKGPSMAMCTWENPHPPNWPYWILDPLDDLAMAMYAMCCRSAAPQKGPLWVGKPSKGPLGVRSMLWMLKMRWIHLDLDQNTSNQLIN